MKSVRTLSLSFFAVLLLAFLALLVLGLGQPRLGVARMTVLVNPVSEDHRTSAWMAEVIRNLHRHQTLVQESGDWIESTEKVQIEPVPNTHLIQISVIDNPAELALRKAAAWQSYIVNLQKEMEEEAMDSTSQNLKIQRLELVRQLDELQSKWHLNIRSAGLQLAQLEILESRRARLEKEFAVVRDRDVGKALKERITEVTQEQYQMETAVAETRASQEEIASLEEQLQLLNEDILASIMPSTNLPAYMVIREPELID